MWSTIILFGVLMVHLFAQGGAQTCPGSGSCNCKFNNVESLRALIRDEVETQVEQEVAERLANMSRPSTGVIYTRWGKSSCPSTDGTQLVYAGRASGSAHGSSGGGGGEILCLPLNPDYIDNPRASSASFYSVLHGGEYDTFGGPHNDLGDHNVPCAVCLASTRASMTMVPAKTQCPTSWTREYYGYLMAERENGVEFAQSSYTCVDVTPDTIAGEAANAAGATTHFAYVIAACNDGIPCPEYEANRVLSCAVCTK